MTINEHETHLAGKLIVDWPPDAPVGDPGQIVYRLSMDWEEMDQKQRWTDKFARFLEDPAALGITGIVVGLWNWQDERSASIVEALVSARDRWPGLTAIFLGDIISEENEISWIDQTDVSPLLAAYPALEYLRVRGGMHLSLGRPQHARLKTLIVESGGLGADVVRQVCAARLPELEHLELWLGDPAYGGDATVENLAPILAGHLFPKLQYLGLRDSEIADQIALALASSPIVERIRVLDLSLGTLGDQGARALLASPAIARLERLDIHHHYCSDQVIGQFESLPVAVDAADAQSLKAGRDERYVAVSE